MARTMNLKTTEKTALVDLELILYRNAAKAATEGTSLRSLVEMTELSIDDVVRGCEASNYYLVVSGRNNFRKTLYPCYKAGRPPKPELYNPLCEAIRDLNPKRWLYHDQLEADDTICLVATAGRVKNPIICSIDKDLRTVSGWHYSWMHDDFPHYISQDQADHNWLVQLLMGDSTDGIKGIVGVGEKKAEKLIKKYRSVMDLQSVPVMAKYIYEQEGISLDSYFQTLYLISIWRANPFPKELLENDLISEITKTIDSIN